MWHSQIYVDIEADLRLKQQQHRIDEWLVAEGEGRNDK